MKSKEEKKTFEALKQTHTRTSVQHEGWNESVQFEYVMLS